MTTRILIIEDNPANLDLMSYLLKAFGHLPLAVTALAMVGDRDKVLAFGFDGYISKPIDPESFVPGVEAFLKAEHNSARPAPRSDTEFVACAAESKKATVLVVDDLAVNLELKRSILEPVGYSVLTADNMAKGLEMARHVPPDLIVSDLGMGDGCGFDFIRATKADPRLKDIPFVFITSTYRDDASRAKGLALGAARFLFRPIEPQALLAEIEACLLEKKGS